MLILRRVQLWCWSINLRLVVTNVCTPAKSFHLWTATYFKHFKERAVITGFSRELIFTIFLICVLTLLPSLQSHDQVKSLPNKHLNTLWSKCTNSILWGQRGQWTLNSGCQKAFKNVFFWSINQTFEKNLTFDILPDITSEKGVVTAESTISLSLAIKRCKCLAIFWRRNFT